MSQNKGTNDKSFMKFILAKKVGMTQVFAADGAVIPVTRVVAEGSQITQILKGKVQVGFSETKEFRLTRPLAGHLKGLTPVKFLREFEIASTDGINRGDMIDVATFVKGEKVTVSGISKGKGFQGVVKRHHFRGQGASHGVKDQERMPGSIGAQGPQHVFKGTRMGGRMGGDNVTVKNLEIVEVNPENNEILLKGAVPGARNGLLAIVAEGEIKIKNAGVKSVDAPEVEEIKEVSETPEVVA